jgi:hypothetical protein
MSNRKYGIEINGAGHWGWLINTLLLSHRDAFNLYRCDVFSTGMLLSRQLFTKNVEIILIRRSSKSRYHCSYYRGNVCEDVTFKNCKEVGDYIQEKASIELFRNQK